MTLFIAIVATCGFMFFQDVFGEGLTISSARGLKFFPGAFDGLGDFVNKYGGAIAAVAAVHYGLTSWQLFTIVCACATTSFFTSNMAAAKASKILPLNRMEKFTFASLWHRLAHPEASA